MSELILNLDNFDLFSLWGSGNEKFISLQKVFPRIKLISRGNELKILGDKNEIESFANEFQIIAEYLCGNQRVDLKTFMHKRENNESSEDNEVIVFGPNGVPIKARTENQKKMAASINLNDILFAVGPAGTGKTYTAVALALRALKRKEVKRIILTRPAVEAGENLGFLPGDLKEKVDPYLRPLYDSLGDMISVDKIKGLLETGIIEVAPLAFMRGRTLNNAFVILDEAQNATDMQLKMFLTRMGPSAKFIVTGDITQVDLPKKQTSGLTNSLKLLGNIKGIDIIYLDAGDVVRHRLVREIIKAYEDI